MKRMLGKTTSIRVFFSSWIWMQPEIKQLASAFRKLRKLFIKAVFVEFDLLWTTAFLEAAPSVEIFLIEVYEPCEMEDVHKQWPPYNKTSPQWELDFCGSKNLALRELHIICFRPLEQQVTIIRVILERAPNLQMVVLSEYGDECDECADMALGAPPSAFPKDEEEQGMVVKRVRDGTSFSGRVIFQ